jgi:patatin-like phospholipase/acyl hydrolase
MMLSNLVADQDASPFRILSLDGGGAKGFYTLGILKEIEALVGSPLHETFPLIFGTSTGAIIAALLALGRKVDETHVLYREHVPTIMRPTSRGEKTQALKTVAAKVFEDLDFSAFKTDIGIVATQWSFERPIIFKTNIRQAHGRQATFIPGFGCKIRDAVQASCSAFPFFERCTLKIREGQLVELADGGYCANNPTLYALADAVRALNERPSNLRVVSLGVGNYPEPKYRFYKRWVRKWPSVRLLQKTLNVNTASMDQLREVLFNYIPTVRISDTFSTPEMATDLMEYDLNKLDILYQRGRDSFAQHEKTLRELLT